MSDYTKLRNFGINNTGNFIRGALIKDQENKLYGMTSGGGSYGAGTIFSYDANSSVFTTRYGGTNYFGVIFSFDPVTLPLIQSWKILMVQTAAILMVVLYRQPTENYTERLLTGYE
jgi:uncharacterized repeat protein (TIGR03803 family)